MKFSLFLLVALVLTTSHNAQAASVSEDIDAQIGPETRFCQAFIHYGSSKDIKVLCDGSIAIVSPGHTNLSFTGVMKQLVEKGLRVVACNFSPETRDTYAYDTCFLVR